MTTCGQLTVTVTLLDDAGSPRVVVQTVLSPASRGPEPKTFSAEKLVPVLAGGQVEARWQTIEGLTWVN